jgi:hypothetical protein
VSIPQRRRMTRYALWFRQRNGPRILNICTYERPHDIDWDRAARFAKDRGYSYGYRYGPAIESESGAGYDFDNSYSAVRYVRSSDPDFVAMMKEINGESLHSQT